MACNKMVWALVGLCALSFSMALIEAAPADGGQANQEAGPAAGPAADKAAGQAADKAAGQPDDPAAGQPAPASKHENNQQNSNSLPGAVYEFLGIVIQTVLDNDQVGSIFQTLPEKTRTAIIEELNPADRKKVLKDNITPDKASKIIQGLTDDQGNSIFDDFEAVKKQTPEDQLQSVLDLSARGLARFAEFDPHGLVGSIIKELDAEKLGKFAVEFLDDYVNALDFGEVKEIFKALVKHLTED